MHIAREWHRHEKCTQRDGVQPPQWLVNHLQSVCTHDVRLTHYGLFTDSYKCVLCDEYIESDNNVTWNLSKNRNKYCVNLIAKYQEGEDYGYVSEGYTKEDVYKIILNILKNRGDDEDIDLIQEFKKLNLKNCDINEEKKKPENPMQLEIF